MTDEKRSSGAGLVVVGGLLMGTLGLFLEQAGQHPLTAVFFRCLFGGAALLAFALATGRVKELRPTRQGMAVAALTGSLMVVMWASFFAAIQWTSIALATVTFHLQPLWLLLAGTWLFGERLGLARALGVFGAFAGLTMATGLLRSGLPGGQPLFAWGLVLAVLGSVCYAAVSLLAKRQRALSSLGLTFWQCATGTLLLAWWPAWHGLPALWGGWPAATWGWLVGLGVLHTGLAYALIYAGVQRLEVGRIALLQFVYPIAAITLDVAIYGRALDGTQWAGVLLMGAALWWAGRTDAVRPLVTQGVQSG